MVSWLAVLHRDDSVSAFPFEEEDRTQSIIEYAAIKELDVAQISKLINEKFSSIPFKDIKTMREKMIEYQIKYEQKYKKIVIISEKNLKYYYAEDVLVDNPKGFSTADEVFRLMNSGS
jgi:hypothetical protein